ncbi:energy-coupling factor ABC transporter permease [Clostridium cellulovorans]|uniref:Cobalt transport protein CbiM n=1 Tax=Clostridium cellulovorans (strain ATCC 35296 / DSM 3052 / OCM 3 / 743B) TaxID=573061 RepID=CBIM_CLOC7|nr:energy-coupling factor ABC transporter permease [Clostridium cellulovorans]D9SNZ5.1 RecName: Full=Cobalt transport protein CbiM; AltName: Full=Energy-coupling factor transporter probable substrate-capture protein CbiM; Short=ECF transporter S component CbiM; Flags: Precursor [Clostridium cellulovorans 743B]ADL51960.1 cobalamin biosynthesis protein CbiM [Clostridium cellulovorans 743B]
MKLGESMKKNATLSVKIIAFLGVLIFTVMPVANAMHIMEGYLSPKWCIIWGILVLPFLIKGSLNVKKVVSDDQRIKLLFAMAGAFIFILSALKLPSFTGTSSHPTGIGLSTILFGPAITTVLGVIVLLFQALLLAHGGISTLGANSFAMAVMGPLMAYGVYKILQKIKIPQNINIFFSATVGDLFTYCITAIQLGIDHPLEYDGIFASIERYLGVFAITQIPIAIAEGILTVLIFNVIAKYSSKELGKLGILNNSEEAEL